MLVVLLLMWTASLAAAQKNVDSDKEKPAASSSAKPTTAKPAPAKGQTRAEWKPRIYKGRTYVTVEAVAAYYGFAQLSRSGKNFSLSMKEPAIKFEGTVGEKRVRLNKMVFYFSFPLISLDSGNKVLISSFDVANVLDPILRSGARRDPAFLKVVVLDAAGGGVEPGIISRFGTEKELTLDLAKRMKPLLERAGYTVVLLRDEDVAIFPLERIRLANLIREEAVYVSLRANASGQTSARGFECSTLPPASTPATFDPESDEVDKRFYPGNINDRESMALATTVQLSVIEGAKANDLGIKRLRFEELRGIEMPAVVCRVGFLTHPDEGGRLQSESYRQTLAQSLATGIHRYGLFLRQGIQERQQEDRQRPLSFGRVQATHLDTSAGIPGEQVVVRLPVNSAGDAGIDRSKMEVQLFVFEKVNAQDVDLTVANPPRIEWLSVLPDWREVRTETLQAIYQRPVLTTPELKEYGRRSYYGYVARLIYNGRLLDEVSDPQNLDRCLYYFTPVFPTR